MGQVSFGQPEQHYSPHRHGTCQPHPAWSPRCHRPGRHGGAGWSRWRPGRGRRRSRCGVVVEVGKRGEGPQVRKDDRNEGDIQSRCSFDERIQQLPVEAAPHALLRASNNNKGRPANAPQEPLFNRITLAENGCSASHSSYSTQKLTQPTDAKRCRARIARPESRACLTTVRLVSGPLSLTRRARGCRYVDSEGQDSYECALKRQQRRSRRCRAAATMITVISVGALLWH